MGLMNSFSTAGVHVAAGTGDVRVQQRLGHSFLDDRGSVGADGCSGTNAQLTAGEVLLQAPHGGAVQVQTLNVGLVDDVGDCVLHGTCSKRRGSEREQPQERAPTT